MSRLLFIVWLLAAYSSTAQQQNFREIKLPDNPYYLCSIELSPNNRTLAIGTAEGNLIFWDIDTQSVIQKFVLDGFKHGPYMSYSSNGRYLLLLE